MAFKMKGFPFSGSPLNQKKIYKEGESYKDKDGKWWVWDGKKHVKATIDLTGVPASEWNKEILRQNPKFKFPKGEKPK